MVNRLPNDHVLFSMNLYWYYCLQTIQACTVTLITPRNQWFQCPHTSGKDFKSGKKQRTKWYISWKGKTQKPCSCLYIQVVSSICYRGNFLTCGKTKPAFPEQVPRRWANFSSVGKLLFQLFQWPFTGYSALLKTQPCSLMSINWKKGLPVGLQISPPFFIKINKPPTPNLCPRGVFPMKRRNVKDLVTTT